MHPSIAVNYRLKIIMEWPSSLRRRLVYVMNSWKRLNTTCCPSAIETPCGGYNQTNQHQHHFVSVQGELYTKIDIIFNQLTIHFLTVLSTLLQSSFWSEFGTHVFHTNDYKCNGQILKKLRSMSSKNKRCLPE